MATIKADDASFAEVVEKADRPVLVDFWATWCAPCRAVAPVLEELSQTYADGLRIVKVDVDEAKKTALRFKIQSIPSLVLFEGGKPTHGVQGAQPKDRLTALLESWVPALRGPALSVQELAAKLDAGERLRIFDIRRPQDYARSHLRGAECVMPDELAARVADNPDGLPTVLICRTGQDSAAEAKRLKSAGYPVYALAKGLLDWEGSGRPTYSTKEEAELAARSPSGS